MATQTTLEQQKNCTSVEVSESEVQRTTTPRTDIYETPEALVLLTDMPGVREDNVEVTLENDVLTLSGTVESKRRPGYRLGYAEYESSNYRRVFTVNTDIARDRIEATLKDGVLKVVLPKVEPAKARKISVRVG